VSALESALALAARGWYVLPIEPPLFDDEDKLIGCGCGDPNCNSIGKHPCADLAPNGQHDSTRDPDLIRDWFVQCEDINIAVDLAKSGLMALDVDHPDGRDAAVAKLQKAMEKLGALPPTVEQISGSGNGHLFYKRPDFPIRGVIEDITVRGRNYCVVAPSRHKSGGYYEWEPGFGPTDIDAAELPANWLAALRKAEPVSDAGVPSEDSEPQWLRDVPHLKRVADMRAHLAKEKGEKMGVDTAGTTWNVIRTAARGYAVRDPAAVMAALLEIYNPKCDPPYGEDALSERLSKAYDNAYSPAWGSVYEPAASKVAAFYAELGLLVIPEPAPPAPPPAGDGPAFDYILHELDGAAAKASRRTSGRERMIGDLIKRVRKNEIFYDEAALGAAVEVVIERAPTGTTDEQLFAVLGHCGNPDKIRELIVEAKARAAEAKAAAQQPPEDDAELRDRLTMTDDGPRGTLPNLKKILRWSEMTRDKLKFDVISKDVTCAAFTDKPELLVSHVQIWLEEEWQVTASERDVGRAMELVAKEYGSWNSVEAYLRSVTWDGTPRLDNWLVDYCGAQLIDRDGSDISSYVSKIGAMWMIGAVARAVAPEDAPAKVDTVLVLEGTQGVGKSTALEILGGRWFTDTAIVIGDKDSRMTASRRWICELAELASLARSATETHKAFLSARSDFYRPPYGHVPYAVARRSVFGGTVNPDVSGDVDYLLDETGNRRWWPIRVARCDVKRLQEDRDQLWAEALYRYQVAEMHPERAHHACPGERWWLEPDEQKQADAVTELRRATDPWRDIVMDWARRAINGINGVKRDRWTLEEIAEGALGVEAKDLQRVKKAIGAALTGAGFTKRKEVRPGDPRRRNYWRHPELSVITDQPAAVPTHN